MSENYTNMCLSSDQMPTKDLGDADIDKKQYLKKEDWEKDKKENDNAPAITNAKRKSLLY